MALIERHIPTLSGWRIIATGAVGGTDVSTLTLSGFNLDDYRVARISGIIAISGGVDIDVNIRPNGLTTNQKQIWTANGGAPVDRAHWDLGPVRVVSSDPDTATWHCDLHLSTLLGSGQYMNSQLMSGWDSNSTAIRGSGVWEPASPTTVTSLVLGTKLGGAVLTAGTVITLEGLA